MKPILTTLLVLVFAGLLAGQVADLSVVPVLGRGRPLTHARIKSVSDKGISFMCDQGIVQVPFEYLPPEFAYYRSMVKLVTPAATPVNRPSVTVRAKSPTESNAVDKDKAKKAAQVARDEAERRTNRKANYLERIREDEYKIDRYTRQNSFTDKVLITTAEYELAKSRLEESKAALAALEHGER